nr:polysaccharide biosynthesis/export family protein [Alteraurantiacibacter aestuarii]
MAGLGAILLIGGCGGGPQISPGIASTTPVTALGQTGYSADVASDYILRPADVISITVFREEDLSLDSMPLSADGKVSLPLVGAVDAAGLTAHQLEQRVEQLLGARFLRDPNVSVNVLKYGSHMVTVEGAVTRAGLFEFQPGTRLSGAIALAAGTSRVADANNLAVFRRTPEGLMVAKFDYAAVQSGTMLDPVLQPGDRIVVGTDGLSQLWQDALRALPVFAIFTNMNI